MADATTTRKTFTYEQAAALLPEVRRLTDEAVRRVESLAAGASRDPETAQREADEVLAGWATAIMSLGIEVKGLWLVDFDNGSGYYCWKHPEDGLQFYHSYEEGFQGRVRIH